MIGKPCFWQLRINGQRRSHAHHGNAAVQHLLHHLIAADAARHHDGHLGHRGDILGELQEIGFAGQGAAVAGLTVHGRGFITAAGQFNQVHAQGIEHGNHLLGLFRTEAAFLEIRRIELHGNGKAFANGLPHFVDDVDQQPRAVFQRTTPAVSALMLPGRPYEVAVSPTMVKALMVHSAQINSPDRDIAQRRYFGAGLPGDPGVVLYDSDSSFTMLFELDIIDSMKWRKAPYPIPPSLLYEGKFRGEVIITAVYSPPLDPSAGAEYVRFNVDVGFGTFTANPGGEPHFKGCVPALGELGTTGLEEAQVEHGGKWSPVKIYRRRFPKGMAGETWGLQATLLRRAFEPQLAQPLRVVIAVTLRALDDNPNIYGEGRRLLAASNWISQDLSQRVDIPVRT